MTREEYLSSWGQAKATADFEQMEDIFIDLLASVVVTGNKQAAEEQAEQDKRLKDIEMGKLAAERRNGMGPDAIIGKKI